MHIFRMMRLKDELFLAVDGFGCRHNDMLFCVPFWLLFWCFFFLFLFHSLIVGMERDMIFRACKKDYLLFRSEIKIKYLARNLYGIRVCMYNASLIINLWLEWNGIDEVPVCQSHFIAVIRYYYSLCHSFNGLGSFPLVSCNRNATNISFWIKTEGWISRWNNNITEQMTKEHWKNKSTAKVTFSWKLVV